MSICRVYAATECVLRFLKPRHAGKISFQQSKKKCAVTMTQNPITGSGVNIHTNSPKENRIWTIKGLLCYISRFFSHFTKSNSGTDSSKRKMDSRLNNEARAYTQMIADNFPQPKDFTVEAIRQRSEAIHAKINEKLIGTFNGTQEDKKVKISDTEISVTIYTPVDASKDKLVVFYHGGGWTVGSRKTHQTIVNMAADATKSIWISVEYRLAPEYKYPIWLDDASEVAQHIIENKTAYGADEDTKIGVAGDSAGAMIAASLCHTLKNVSFQILVYGLFDFAGGTPSYQEFTQPVHLLTPEVLKWFNASALRDENDMKDPRASVLLNKSFGHVPPCLFIVAELDPLRDGSYNYQKVLEEADVKTRLMLVKGSIHSFFSLPGIYQQACGQVINAIQEFLASL